MVMIGGTVEEEGGGLGDGTYNFAHKMMMKFKKNCSDDDDDNDFNGITLTNAKML